MIYCFWASSMSATNSHFYWTMQRMVLSAHRWIIITIRRRTRINLRAPQNLLHSLSCRLPIQYIPILHSKHASWMFLRTYSLFWHRHYHNTLTSTANEFMRLGQISICSWLSFVISTLNVVYNINSMLYVYMLGTGGAFIVCNKRRYKLQSLMFKHHLFLTGDGG